MSILNKHVYITNDPFARHVYITSDPFPPFGAEHVYVTNDLLLLAEAEHVYVTNDSSADHIYVTNHEALPEEYQPQKEKPEEHHHYPVYTGSTKKERGTEFDFTQIVNVLVAICGLWLVISKESFWWHGLGWFLIMAGVLAVIVRLAFNR